MPKEITEQELNKEEGQYAIRPQDKSELKRTESNENDIPAYRIKLELSEDQKEALTKEFQEQYEAICSEIDGLGLPAYWAERDRQYNGEMRANTKLNFNLHVHQSKVKEDAVVRALNEAFLDSEPMVDISPRPEFSNKERQDSNDICDKQTQFIDFAMDEEIKPESDLVLINRSSFRKFVGIGKLEWCYKKEKRKREETYEGKNEIVGLDQQGQPVIENKALKEFINNYPDAETRYPQYVKKLREGKTVNIVVEYLETINNCPKLRFVRIENFKVKNSVAQSYEGLRNTPFKAEIEQYSWYELEEKAENEEFDKDAVESIKNEFKVDDKKGNSSKTTYLTGDYEVVKATMCTEVDGDEQKMWAWFHVNKGNYRFLGAILYPYFGFESDYIPFYIKLNDEGFYGGCKSVSYDMKDSNIAQDAILNLSLTSMYKRNILTPIVKEGSEIAEQFLENRWVDGRPITVDILEDDVNKAVSFVNYPPIDLNQFMAISAQLKKIDSDVSGVSDLMTGRESPSDPRAPASKTMALLNQSGINIKDYIRIYLPSFNTFISNILQLYYQMSQEGKKFKVSALSKAVTGDDPFALLSRDEMVAKTSIQARASAFAFDKMNEKQENMAMYQFISASPLAMIQPDLVYESLKMVMKSWSPAWKQVAENDLMSKKEFDQFIMKIGLQGLMQLMQAKQLQAQTTGVTPDTTQDEIMQSMMASIVGAIAPQAMEKK